MFMKCSVYVETRTIFFQYAIVSYNLVIED